MSESEAEVSARATQPIRVSMTIYEAVRAQAEARRVSITERANQLLTGALEGTLDRVAGEGSDQESDSVEVRPQTAVTDIEFDEAQLEAQLVAIADRVLAPQVSALTGQLVRALGIPPDPESV